MKYFVYKFIKNPDRFGYLETQVNEDLKKQGYFYNNVFDKWIKLDDVLLDQYKKLLNNNDVNSIHENYLINMYLPYTHKNQVYFGKRHLMEQIYNKNYLNKS